MQSGSQNQSPMDTMGGLYTVLCKAENWAHQMQEIVAHAAGKEGSYHEDPSDTISIWPLFFRKGTMESF
jgi:hypothetical protein